LRRSTPAPSKHDNPHLIKGGISALLLIVLGALTVLLWRTFLQADGLGMAGRAALALAGAAVPMLALLALAVVMANIQGRWRRSPRRCRC
jgi:hypothetical protein